MSAVRFIAAQYRESNVTLLFWVGLAFIYYSFQITGGSFDFFHDHPREIVSGVVFNSMLAHLLQGDFSVDPDAIRQEAFVKDGKTYAYFGIGLALLRLPLLPFRDFATIDITPLSIVIATCIAAYFKCASLLLVRRLGHDNPAQTALYGVLILSILMGGPQVQFLKAVIYQEVICWAMALESAFMYGALRGLLLPRRFSTPLLVTLACLAGVALLTRVTAGIGLYAALGLLLLALGTRACWPVASGVGAVNHAPLSLLQWLTSRQVIFPSLVLIVFAGLTGTVNYARWGNPLVFADMHFAPMMVESGRIAVLDQYGEFNLLRFPYAVIYYFFPINFFLHGPLGGLPFDGFPRVLFDGVEPPLSTFLVTDPALVLLAGAFFVALVRNRVPVALDRRQTTALLVGFLLPVFLLLAYFFLAFRFRGEFYLPLDFAAILGFYALGGSANDASRRTAWGVDKILRYSVIVGIAASHVLLAAYKAIEWT